MKQGKRKLILEKICTRQCRLFQEMKLKTSKTIVRLILKKYVYFFLISLH